jgi:hypothetical protein
MWTTVECKMIFQERLCGSVPLNKEIVKSWLQARGAPENAEEEVMSTIEDIEEKVTLGFQRDENGLFVRGGTIKAHIKDCANQIKDIVKIKNLRSKIANKVYVEESRIYLQKDRSNILEVDGVFDQPVHVITNLGPRNALKTIQYITRPTMEFHLRILEDKEIDVETIKVIFEYGSIHGFGGERGMGEGRYKYEIEG